MTIISQDKPGVCPYGTYSNLASEYYDPLRHPTCANFREASQILLFPWLYRLVTPKKRVIEVGAGRSVVAEWLRESRRNLATFIATDLSLEMLHYSQGNDSDQDLIVADAQRLPFAENFFDLAVSSLGDPYNTPLFWGEMARVLRPGAIVLFSTPSFQWACRFRQGRDAAEFSLLDGHIITVPSYVRSPESQCQLIEHSGLTLMKHCHVDETVVRESPRSPKLRPGSVVSLYIARKYC